MAKKQSGKKKQPGERKVLQGHRREGKRFIPPFLQYINMQEVGWRSDLIPELIWIALLIDHFGMHRGVELCASLAKSAAQCTGKPTGAHAFISEYSALMDQERDCIRDRLSTSDELAAIVTGLSALLVNYPQSPLMFLGQPDDDSGLEKLKLLITALMDRRDKTATFVQSTAVYIYFVNNKLKVPPDSALANFTAIEMYPDTDESQKIASFVRATMNGMVPTLDLPVDWRNYFRDRGRSLEPCEPT